MKISYSLNLQYIFIFIELVYLGICSAFQTFQSLLKVYSMDELNV